MTRMMNFSARLSDEASALLRELKQPQRIELLRRAPRRLDVLDQLARLREPRLMAELLGYVFDANREVRSRVAEILAQLLRDTPPEKLHWLDELLRPESWRWSATDWASMKPAQLRKLLAYSDAANTLLALAASHPSGFVRQAAVRHLADQHDTRELPFLLLRAADWVENVRQEAAVALEARLVPGYAEAFVRNYALVLRLQQTTRQNYRLLVASIESLVSSSATALDVGLVSADRRVRRALFRINLARSSADVPALLERALRDVDPAVRIWALRTPHPALDREQLGRLLAMALNDSVPIIRRMTLELYLSELPGHAEAAARGALFDRSTPVRQQAQGMMRVLRGPALDSIYRSEVGEARERTLPGALLGLSETGSAEDRVLIEPYLSHKMVNVRNAAAAALGRVADTHETTHFLKALADPSPRVSRTALNALLSRLKSLTVDTLKQIMADTSFRHTRLNGLKLIRQLGKWTSIPAMVEATADSNPDVRARAHLYVQAWLIQFNRNSMPPSAEQARALRSALARHQLSIPRALHRQLAFTVKE
jgi:HEAT repeat protein